MVASESASESVSEPESVSYSSLSSSDGINSYNKLLLRVFSHPLYLFYLFGWIQPEVTQFTLNTAHDTIKGKIGSEKFTLGFH